MLPLRTLDHKYILFQGGLLPVYINVEWKIRKLLSKAKNKVYLHLILIKDQFRGIEPET